MSHANGEVIKDDKVIGYFEYNGTVDIARPAFWDTYEEMLSYWKVQESWRNCSCIVPKVVNALLYTDYGKGFHWPAKVCLKCKTIIDNLSPFETEITPFRKDGHPLRKGK